MASFTVDDDLIINIRGILQMVKFTINYTSQLAKLKLVNKNLSGLNTKIDINS